MEKGSFQDGNPMEVCCTRFRVVSLMFPLKGNRFFLPVTKLAVFKLLLRQSKNARDALILVMKKKIKQEDSTFSNACSSRLF